MQDPVTYPLPFLVRDMLKFEYGTKIELVVYSRSFTAEDVVIVGATREGMFKFTQRLDLTDTGRTDRFSIPDIPIWVSVLDKDEVLRQGATFIKVDLAVNGDKVQALCSGYVDRTKSITWPATNLQASEPTKGQIDTGSSADPAAGSNISLTIPNGEHWRIIAIRFSLVTSATIANRRVHLVFNPKQGGSFDTIASVDQTASQTIKYSCAPMGTTGTFADDNDILIPIPDNLILPGESQITTTVTNLQAGDNFGVMDVHRERFIAALN